MSQVAGRALLAALLAHIVGGMNRPAQAAGDHDWAPASLRHLLAMPHDKDAERSKQVTPPSIPPASTDSDAAGAIGTVNAQGPTDTPTNAFFQDLGTNGRTCFSCHQPDSGWGISTDSIQRTFNTTQGNAPIFRPVDGAVCPTADVSSKKAKQDAYSLLLNQGLIRIALPVPAGAEFSIAVAQDPYGCNTNPATGLTSPTAGIVSTYRRPLPATNLGFLNTFMWDGREPSLASQAADATIGHAQAATGATPDQVAQIVAFESGLLTAQSIDSKAGPLNANGANGGPAALQATLAGFFQGINDPLGGNPKGIPFTSVIFSLYTSWDDLAGQSAREQTRASIARGEAIFNSKPIVISGVNGINDALGVPALNGFCGTCHSTPNVGNHSVKLPINIGIANAGPFNAATGTGAAPVLDIAALPVFTVTCTSGPNQGTTYTVTDLGKAMISGKCADVGKMKGPILRGLAGRAPYFHNGSARTLDDAVTFYDQRFGIGFTAQEKQDLIAFLNSL